MKKNRFGWLGLLFVLALLVMAYVPALTDFNTSQFNTASKQVSVRAAGTFTNEVFYGVGGGPSILLQNVDNGSLALQVLDASFNGVLTIIPIAGVDITQFGFPVTFSGGAEVISGNFTNLSATYLGSAKQTTIDVSGNIVAPSISLYGANPGILVSNTSGANGSFVTVNTNGTINTYSNVSVGFGGASYQGLMAGNFTNYAAHVPGDTIWTQFFPSNCVNGSETVLFTNTLTANQIASSGGRLVVHTCFTNALNGNIKTINIYLAGVKIFSDARANNSSPGVSIMDVTLMRGPTSTTDLVDIKIFYTGQIMILTEANATADLSGSVGFGITGTGTASADIGMTSFAAALWP